MECLVKILLWSSLVTWTTNAQFLSKFNKKEVFFVNLEEGFFGCQVNETLEVLQIFKIEKLCDGTSDCYLGSDENQKELKCSNNCLYTTGHRCINGACLDSQCHCNDGWGGKGCSMPDENECKYRPCDVFAHCTNNIGSYECTCFPGYEGDGHSCQDIDECSIPELAGKCVENAECCNLPAEYVCKCKQGFEGDGQVECRDIDECREANACGANSLCNNYPGNYTCSCQDGYAGDPYTGCVDLNECLSNPCGAGARCINQYGGYLCECPPGARGNPYTNCGSLDQCQSNPCGVNAKCFNEGSSYRCECPQGFQGNPKQQCIDINECLRNPCGQNAECSNTEGSYQCTCKAGLTGDPFTSCSDTDECAAQFNPCGVNAVCRNTNPGYKCECPPGFTGNGNVACEATEVRTLCKSNFDCTNNAECDNGQCVCRPGFTAAGTLCLDVDECRSTPGICGANAVCVNTLGSFTCSCLPSFVGSPPNVGCSEPCQGVKCSEHAFCKAEDKEAYCECEPGWTYDPSNIAAGCVDVNECGQPGTCGDNSICTNLPGSYLCQCKPGFTGNPQVRCIDIDECSSVTTCGFGRTCQNLPGSYRCGCPAGAVPDPNNPSECINIKTCQKNQDCPGNAFCSKEKVCVCPEPNQGPNCESPCANIFCAANSLCTLLNGEPRCMCHQGYQPAGPGLQGCIDVNECLGRPCGKGAFCENMPGAYRCLCPSGFTGDPNVACIGEQNKEQCSSTRPCPAGELCSQGKCVCQRGFQREGDFCRDIDECALASPQNPVCGQNAFCKNLPGSFDCECPQGYNGNPFVSCNSCNGNDCGCPPPYSLDSTGSCVLEGCKTKAECAQGAECVSIAGGVSYCACPAGFNAQPDGSCADIDECSASSRPCGFGALCENKIGSFSCVCPLGTTGDPYNGLCSANQVQCSRDDDCRPNEKCVEPGQCICPPPFFADTTDGGKCKSPCERFQCGINADCSPTNPPQCLCKTGYGGDPIRGCIDVDECLGNPCGPNARCVNEDGSYKCQCPKGTKGDPYLAGCVGSPSRVECTNDDECPGQLACQASTCINPCSTIPCGDNAICIPEDHAAWCRCKVGYKENSDGKCTSMCDGMICGLNAQCIIAPEGPTCACSKGTFGNPFPGGSCVPETCSVANPCPGPLTCISGQCRERCDASSCGLNAACDPSTNKCFCKEGFVGDGNFLCMPPILPAICSPGCGGNSHCVYNIPNKCECNPGFGGNPYEGCAPSTELDVVVPCQCGTNAECVTEGYTGQVCKCKQGYDGNPFVGCFDVNECNNNFCGRNAVCINTPGSYDCRCEPDHKGNPFDGCFPDQPLVTDLCNTKQCGPNAVCKDGQCLCLTGFQGDANDVRRGCQSSTCSTNLDCGYNEICQSVKGQYRCVDACGNVQCGPNSRCVTDNHHSTCICQDGFSGNPSDLRGGCSRQVTCKSEADCPPGTMCSINISGRKSCVDPCRVMSCGNSEHCAVRNNRPFCECNPTHVRNPLTNKCELASVPSCTNDNQCSQDQVCKPDSLGVLRCTPVCQLFTCPPNSQCRASNHQGFCHCFEGYSGNPKDRKGCYLTSKDQCTSDSQCGEEEVCSSSLKKCIPACNTITCGPQAVCITQNHSPRCTCPPGKFKGDPTDPIVGCKAVSCLTNADCPPTKFCDRLSYKCMDVCTADTCGTNAVCLPENQRAKCSCPPGTRPDPLPEVACTTINACSNNPCHRSAKCRPTATGFSCLCPQGQVGDPYKSGCFPEGSCPNGDRDCPDQSICVSGRCKNICYDGCGPNTECTIKNRQAHCQCLAGFIPSPLDPRTCIRDSQVCRSDSDCVGGSTCQAGTCRYACRGQNDCLVGEQCSDSMCMISCISSQQCPANQVCSAGVCSVGCRNNENCPSDEVCINFKCINPCQQEGACGPNALCRIFNKNVQCTCPERFAGVPTPQQGCVRIPSRCPTGQCPPVHTCKGGLCHLQCSINADCAKGERCLDGLCTKVCHSDKNCLQGEICIETSCQPGCNKEEDCRPGEICENGNCVCGLGFINTPSGCTDINECEESRCHPSAKCQNTPGSFKCTCPRGLIGDPYSSGCKDPNECRTNRDCGASLACAGDGSGYRKCVNPCDRARCGSNTECVVVNNRPQCRCADKHVGNPNTALGCTKVECEKNNDCSGDKICQTINNRCVDACSLVSCGRGTCSAENHQPFCRCEPGYIFSEQQNRCVDIDECQNSPCQPTAVCVNTIGAYQCQCPPGTVPDPFGRCKPSDQCLTNNDCPSTAVCSSNGKCQNPCDIPGSCGADALCTPANHKPVCSCPPGTSGNAYVRCIKHECVSNNDCPGERTCVRNKCVDVCSLPNVCGQNTNCRAINHVARCHCLPGFTGEPTLGCTQLQLCTNEEQCPSGMLCSFGICSPPCQSSRDCLDNQLCNGGSCIAKCNDDTHCPPLHSCQNSLCIQESRCSNDIDCGETDTCVGRDSGLFECEDACAGPVICGRNAQCTSRGHKPYCTCPDGFFGDPNDEKIGCQKKQCLVNGDCPGDSVCNKFLCTQPSVAGSCSTDRNCAANEVCNNGQCKDPCSVQGACGLNAYCSVSNHRKQCVCPQDFTGNPEVECVRIPSTCFSSTDCPQPLQCSDGICMPSCSSDESCALNERCLQGLCMLTCRVDNDCFLGHVCLNKMCIVGCRKNSDCPESNTCINNRCTDPCTTACGPNAKCQVVNHRAQCSCPSGYIPNPSPVVACVKQPQICSNNAQCPDRQVCDGKFCKDVCFNDKTCGKNEVCDNGLCKAMCRVDDDCNSQEICRGVTCVLGCRSSSSCPADQACINNQCTNPCTSSTAACGSNALCSVSNHQALCSCPAGLTGDPTRACAHPVQSCTTSGQCGPGSKCIGGLCAVTCSSSNENCLLNEVCVQGTCRPLCNSNEDCNNGYICKERFCVAGCTADSQCGKNEACIDSECKNPCFSSQCGQCAECSVSNHEAFCSCPPTSTGNPLTGCLPLTYACSSSSDCNRGDRCQDGVCIKKCRKGSDCECGKTCVDGTCRQECSGNIPCPQGHLCQGGVCQPGCLLDADCSDQEVCNQGQCTNPCSLASTGCARSAECKVSNHRPVCICPQGLQGNPKVECRKVECRTDNECESIKSCVEGQCVNLCQLPNACGTNAQCKVIGHRKQCTCPVNFIGNPTVECTPDKNECVSSPCGQNAICQDLVGSYSCQCLPGCTGDPFSGCLCGGPLVDPCSLVRCGLGARCEVDIAGVALCVCSADKPYGDPLIECVSEKDGKCRGDFDCPPIHSCHRGRCVDPCSLRAACGKNAICSVFLHKPRCECPQCHIGLPQVACRPDPACNVVHVTHPSIVEGCTSDKNCPLTAACSRITRKCYDPCASFSCDSNKVCEVSSHKPTCRCKYSLVVNQQGLLTCPDRQVECRSDEECPSNQGCDSGRCVNPCDRPRLCEAGKECQVLDHKAVCICTTGCNPSVSICLKDRGCPRNQACINLQCKNPCEGKICPGNTPCIVEDHQAICKFCPPGFETDANYGCIQGSNVGCRSNSECPAKQACQNKKCVNPCTVGYCGATQNCEVANHRAQCIDVPRCECVSQNDCQRGWTCEDCECVRKPDIDGVIGCDPDFDECSEQCTQNSDCPEDKYCDRFKRKCISVCPGFCGDNTVCSFANHNPICSCKPGFQGNADVGCSSIPAIGNPCIPSPCGVGAVCELDNGNPICSCPRGKTGNPFVRCINDGPKCRGNQCGPNAGCRMIADRPVCYCLPRYEGNPPAIPCVRPVKPCKPNPCGANTECVVVNNVQRCTCKPGFTESINTIQGCVPIESPVLSLCEPGPCGDNAECLVNDSGEDCRCYAGFTGNPFQGCIAQNPCKPSPCGPNTECSEDRAGQVICTCRRGFQGDPVSPQGCKAECLTNDDCSSRLACIAQKCIDPCPGTCGVGALCEVRQHNPICSCPPGTVGDPFTRCAPEPVVTEPPRPKDPCSPNPCGINANCKVQSGQAVCQCVRDYQGDPLVECKPECLLSFDCPQNLACINTKCLDPCPGTCGINAECSVVNHNPVCKCHDGYHGDPFVQCSLDPGFITPPEPVDPCTPSPCGPNAECHVAEYRPVCTCLPGYFGAPPDCRPECVINSECPPSLACINLKCANPCVGVCGINAKCDVVAHNPICSCPVGYIGDPFTSCRQKPPVAPVIPEPTDPCNPDPCGPYSECRREGPRPVCSCLKGYFGGPPNCRPECLLSSECPLTKACVQQKCVDPCPGTCGANAECKVVNHNPICSCPKGFSGDPFYSCNKEPDVITPSERPHIPCVPSPCGPNAQCKEINGYESCTCLPGFIGAPPNCRPECVLNAECPSNKACIQNKCSDPCVGACGYNARCTAVNHNAICNCPAGYTGDPFSGCSLIPEVITKPEIIDPCNPSPCGANAICSARDRAGSCRCIPDHIGDPYVGCRPECLINTECPNHLACVQKKCKDPCPGTCGINAQCTVRNHNPICTCNPGYTGDATSACTVIPPPEPIELDLDPCDPNPCGPNSQHREVNGVCVCACIPGYQGNPPNCRPECVVSSDCSQLTACINQKCVDPCPGTCGNNARCQVTNHNPICQCPPGYTGDPFSNCVREVTTTPAPLPVVEDIDPCNPSPCGPFSQCQNDVTRSVAACTCLPNYIGVPPNCRPECSINPDCPSNRACVRERCIDPCPGSCGPNAECQVINHQPICRCPPGYDGDPFRECRVVIQTTTFRTTELLDPCDPSPCGSNAQCKSRNRAGACTCIPGYFGDPYLACRPECVLNTDCPTNKACVNNKCVDPCPGVCGINAVCNTNRHQPVCTCLLGYTGDPITQCSLIPTGIPVVEEIDPCDPNPCGPYSQFREGNGVCICSCEKGMIGAPPNCRPECLVSSECSQSTACIQQQCRDPCPGLCGYNAECRVTNHNPICSCNVGYEGDPFTGCTLIPVTEKVTQPPAPIDPCNPDPCGPFAQCRRQDNIAACSCLPGYIGTPPNCRPECRIHSECASNLACINEKCRDPCPGACGSYAECEVINHNAVCRCQQGYEGDPFVGCRRVTTPPPPPRDPCNPNPCGANADARVSGSSCICSCRPEYFGDPYSGCRPECVVNSDCLTTLACVNQHCVDPCPGVCGFNAECRVINHNPVCTCLSGYEGDPFRGCSLRPEPVINDPCDPNPCGPGAIARQVGDECQCSCPPGLFGDPYRECKPECVINSDCPSDKACRNYHCYDPCIGTCGQNAQCEVRNHSPLCSCLPGYIGNALIECHRPPPVEPVATDPCDPNPCGQNAFARPSGDRCICTCPPGLQGDPYVICKPECTVDSDCPNTLACISQKCKDPCVYDNQCGINAICQVNNHRSNCICPPGYEGNAYQICTPIREPPKPECVSDPECPVHLACIGQKCRDPCIPEQCGDRAICRVNNHRAVCICPPPLEGNPYTACIEPGCKSDLECPLTDKCINRNCVDACSLTQCGIDALCESRDHKARCYCPPRYRGDPYVACTRPECIVDDECPQVLACRNEHCVDPCDCAPNAQCIVRSHRARCQCPVGYTGDPYTGGCYLIPEPEPECRVDADCPSRLACLNEVCRDPCGVLSPCGQNAQCTVQNTLPQRTMICMCIPGYVGDADIACNLPPPPPSGCSSNNDCSDQEICRDRACINPCIAANPCATNAICDVRSHSVTCNCPSGYTGDPFANCYPIAPRPECTEDPDCPQSEACINERCIDPCIVSNPCAPQAQCTTRAHHPVCTCPQGYGGDPYRQCYRPECRTDTDCPLDKACINENCLNPCANTDRPCGRGAECIVEFHQSRCVCSAGLQGNPLVACVNVECRTDDDCRQDQACDFISQTCEPVCGPGTCAQDASCQGINHQPECTCNPGTRGSGFISCIRPIAPIELECRVDDDCGPRFACINNECQDPCEATRPCHHTQICRVENSSPIRTVLCTCPDDTFIGPNGECKPKVTPTPSCVTDRDCRDPDKCVEGTCRDACNVDPCGSNAICKSRAHASSCTCPIGYTGNPKVQCLKITPDLVPVLAPECRDNSECPLHTACINRKCLNPCAVTDPCATNAFCRVDNHEPICTCPSGYIGDPRVSCIKPEPVVIVGCTTNDDCPQTEACFNRDCVDPCNCGTNAQCYVTNHKPVCFCPEGYTGNPEVGCVKVGCSSDSECAITEVCTNRNCLDACIANNPCAPNAECYSTNHQSACRCPPGLEGDPYVNCIRVECRINQDCSQTSACINNKCANPCLYENPCAPSATCSVQNHVAKCTCPPGWVGNPLVSCTPKLAPVGPEPDPECITDGDCPDDTACLNERCENPCHSLSPCHVTSVCSVENTLPFRTMICTCRPGWEPETDTRCKPVEIPNPPGCARDDDCPNGEACINRQCKDPCDCGTGAQCFVEDHRPVCVCPPGYVGNPQISCEPIGCQSDGDCRDRETCVSGECVNPCLLQDPCGRFAECYPSRHRANCRCLPGYEGDPFVGCEVIGCRTDPECPTDKACRNKDCINPCFYENPCATNAECLVSNHQPQCRCPIGYTGNPRVACIPIPGPECVQDQDCPSQHACLDSKCRLLCPALSPCKDPATCSVVDSLPVRTMICSCPDGFVATDDNSCKTLAPIISGCSTDDECGETDSCINKICKDPCACGDHAFCRVINHKPVCTCEEGYEGNPDVACIKVECRVDDDCLDTHACRNEQCRPVCGPGNAPCGGEAICTAENHKAICSCPPGLEGDPFVTCREIECRSDRDCPSDKACYNNHCISPCKIQNPCQGVAECTVIGHEPNCECPPGFEGSKGTSCTKVEIGCRSDTECPSQLACINQQCVQPCDLADPCGRNAKCTVLDTAPVRTMVCICITGYQGNAAVECTPVPTCPPGRGLILNEREECVCPPGHYTNDEGVCVRCPTELGFVLIGNQCICDSSRGLVLSDDGTKCVCPPGFIMGPDGVCIPDLECRLDDDCIDIKYCELSNNTCGDPCVKWPCGANAYGTPGGHRCQCRCIEGYTGDPYTGCTPIPAPPTTPSTFNRPDLEVNCLADGVLVNIGLVDDNFKGVMYVKGHSNDERCRQSVNFAETGRRIVDFKVLFGVCGLFHSDGEANFILVIQKHPKLVTYKSQAYRIKCVYNTGIQNIDVSFNVSMLTTAGTIANTGPPPTCSMRICNSNGQDINTAEIGDNLMLKVDVQPNAIYGGFARSCVAHTMDDNDKDNEYLVTDENGCATDPSIFGEWQYERQKGVLTSVFNAFKFPSSNNIRFQCNIRVCFGQCQPQNCAGSNAYGRKKRQADAEEAQVYTGQLREEIKVESNAILTIERRTESRIDPQTSLKGDEDVCVSKIGFIIALVITALLALVAVAIAVSCWLMAYRRRPKAAGPLPHPAEFPNPLFTTPTPPLAEPAPDYLS